MALISLARRISMHALGMPSRIVSALTERNQEDAADALLHFEGPIESLRFHAVFSLGLECVKFYHRLFPSFAIQSLCYSCDHLEFSCKISFIMCTCDV